MCNIVITISVGIFQRVPHIYSYAILYYYDPTVDLCCTAVDHRRLAELLLHDLRWFRMVRTYRRAVSTVIKL